MKFEYDSEPKNLEELKKQQIHFMRFYCYSLLFATFTPIFAITSDVRVGSFIWFTFMVVTANFIILAFRYKARLEKLDELSKTMGADPQSSEEGDSQPN